MTIYRAEDFELAARRIEAFMERGDPRGVGRKHWRAAVAALRLSAERIRMVEASWPPAPGPPNAG